MTKPFPVTCAAGWCGFVRSVALLGEVPEGWFLVSTVVDGLVPVCELCAEIERALFGLREWLLLRKSTYEWVDCSPRWGGRCDCLPTDAYGTGHSALCLSTYPATPRRDLLTRVVRQGTE